MTISFSHFGDFKKIEKFLSQMHKLDISKIIKTEANRGVNALSSSTPIDSGLASTSWGVEIQQSRKNVTITWTNSDVENGFPVAIMLQYGYGTGTGGYVAGIDYINPAMKPVFDQIAETVWKAVTSA